MAEITKDLLETLEARALSSAVGDFDHNLRRFISVSDVIPRDRSLVHTREPSIPAGLFTVGDTLVAAFDLPSKEAPEVADLLRAYCLEGRKLRPAPNPFAHHKGLNHWISDLYLSHRGRVRFLDVRAKDGLVYLVFSIRYDDEHFRRQILGLDITRGPDDIRLLHKPYLPDPIPAEFQGLPELDRAPWETGRMTIAHYYHTRVGPLYVFVDWGTIKVRDYQELPRGAADLVIEGAADPDQPLNPHRAEVLWPATERDAGEALVRIQPAEDRPTFYVYYSTSPRHFEQLDSDALSGLNLPDSLGKITSMFLWAGNELIYLGGLPAAPLELWEAPGNHDRLYVFRDEERGYTLHHFDLEKRKVVHSFFPLLSYALLPDGHLFLQRCSADGSKEPALEHPIECFATPFRSSSQDWSPEEQSYLRSFPAEQVAGLVEAARAIETLLDQREYRSAFTALDRILVEHSYVERVPAVREAIGQLHDSLGKCLDVEEQLAEIHSRRRETLEEFKAEVEDSLPGLKARADESLDEALRAVRRIRELLGQLERLAAEGQRPEEVIAAQQELRTRLAAELRALSERAALHIETAIQAAHRDTEALERSVPTLETTESAETARESVRRDLRSVTDAVDALRQLDLAPQRSLELSQWATDGVVKLERLETEVRKRGSALDQEQRQATFDAYLIQLDMRVTTEPRSCSTPEICDGRRDALLAEIETHKANYADFEALVRRLEERAAAVHRRYDARKGELLRQMEEQRRVLETRFELRLRALQVAARGSALKPAALEGFLASHPEALQCQTIIEELTGIGAEGAAAALRGRLDQSRRLLLAESQERGTFALEGETLRLAGVRFHRNRQRLLLREARTSRGVGLALSGSGLSWSAEELGGLKTPEGYIGMLSETPEISRAELLAWRVLRLAESGGRDVLRMAESGGQNALDTPAIQALDWSLETLLEEGEGTGARDGKSNGLEERCRALAIALPDEEYTVGLHDRDAAILLQKIVPAWSRLGLLRWPSSVRVAAARAWSRVKDPQEVLRRVLAVRALGSFIGRASASRQLLTEAIRGALSPAQGDGFNPTQGGFPDSESSEVLSPASTYEAAILDYLEAEVEAGGLSAQSSLVIHPRAAELALELLEQQGEDAFLSGLDALGDWEQQHTFLLPALRKQLEPGAAGDQGLVPEVAWLLHRMAADRSGTQVKVHINQHVTDVSTFNSSSLLPTLPTMDSRVASLPEWYARITHFVWAEQPQFRRFRQELDAAREGLERELDLSSLTARPLARFVWTRLHQRAYLPTVASALEKQLGSFDRPGEDQMGLLLLISPPGYGKTELLKKLASLLGYAFVSVSGTTLGKDTRSLDPAVAPDGNAAAALSRLRFGLELRDNVLLDIEDIQACSDAFLDKLLPLCDATRTVEVVRDGRPELINLQGRRAAVVLTLNPLHATIPRALANRATMINLGDVAEKYGEDFALSYLEVAASANPTLEPAVSHLDLEALARAKEEGRSFDAIEGRLNGRYARAELQNIDRVLEQCIAIRDVVMAVNRACLESASMQEAFRVTPAFELQGSYRDMIEICRDVGPDWTVDTRRAAILRHYEGQAGLLGEQGEYNLLALKSLIGELSEEERERLGHIREVFKLAQQRDRAVYVLMERLAEMSGAIGRVPASIANHGEALATRLDRNHASSREALDSLAQRTEEALRQLHHGAKVGHEALAAGLHQDLTQLSDRTAQTLKDISTEAGRLLGELSEQTVHAMSAGTESLDHSLQRLADGFVERSQEARAESQERMEASAARLEAFHTLLTGIKTSLAQLPPAFEKSDVMRHHAMAAVVADLIRSIQSAPLPVIVQQAEASEWSESVMTSIEELREYLRRLAEAAEFWQSRPDPIVGSLRALREDLSSLPVALEKTASSGRQSLEDALRNLARHLQTVPLPVKVQEAEMPAWANGLLESLNTLREELAQLNSAARRPQRNDFAATLKALASALPEADGE